MLIHCIYFDRILYELHDAIDIIKSKFNLPLTPYFQTCDYFKFYYTKYNKNIRYKKAKHSEHPGIIIYFFTPVGCIDSRNNPRSL